MAESIAFSHRSVLPDECMEGLRIRPDGIYVDGTAGGAGHSSMIAARLGLDETTPIDARILSNSIESAQKRIEANNFSRRKNVLTYDDVMNEQRKIVYDQRYTVLTEKVCLPHYIVKAARTKLLVYSVTLHFSSVKWVCFIWD